MSEAFSRTPCINLGEIFPSILTYMENTAVMLFMEDCDYTPGNLTVIAQSDRSGAYFSPLSTVRPITRPTANIFRRRIAKVSCSFVDLMSHIKT